MALGVTAALTMIVGVADATSGGPTFVEVLGHDVRDGKIYYQVNSEDADEKLPQIFFLRLDGKHAGKPQRVRSLTKGLGEDIDADHETLTKRVEKLKRRLARMKPSVESKRDENRFAGDELPKGVGKLQLKRVVKKRTWDEYSEVECRLVEVSLSDSKSKASGVVRVRECNNAASKGHARVTAIYDLKGRADRFVLVSSEGKPYEGGYEVQVPVLLRKSTAD